MSLKRIASLAVGLLGLLVIINSLPLLHSMVWQFVTPLVFGRELNDQTFDNVVFLYLLIVFIITLGCSILLIVFRNRIGTFLIGEEPHDQENKYNTNQCHAAAISVVGLYFIVSGIAEFFGRFTLDFKQSSTDESSVLIFLLYSLPYAVKLILGIILFFGSHGIAAFWKTLFYRAKSEWKGIKNNE